MRCFLCLILCSVFVLFVAVDIHASGEPAGGEVYGFQTLGVSDEGDESFVDMSPGNDMLPYTADDIELPEGGNAGGTWALAHFDSNSNGEIDLTTRRRDDTEEEVVEQTFTILRRDDDDRYGFAAQSHPEFGVIYESEDWVDYHAAENDGPTATLPEDDGDKDFDWEYNDDNAWDSEANAYLFNNLQANQHGKGKPKYYFENINPGGDAAAAEPWVYDEVAGYTKRMTPVTPVDDPTTVLDERNTCRRNYINASDHVIRGYIIPVDDLETLEDGSLPTLFGWEDVDLAAYFRETIVPRLDDPGLTRYDDDLGTTDPALTLPITHIMLYQVETPLAVVSEADCAGAADVAAYWGVQPEGGTLRVSHIMGFDAEATQTIFGEDVKFWEDVPADEVARNLWLLEHFWIDEDSPPDMPLAFPAPESSKWTTLAGPWEVVDDPGFAFVDTTPERILRSQDAGLAQAPLPRALTTEEQPLELVVDVARLEGDVVQIGLLKNGEVLAYAEMSDDSSTVYEGGSVGDDAVSGGTAGDPGDAADAGFADTGEYTRVVLRVSPTDVTLANESPGNYTTSQFTDLADFPQLASVTLSAENAVAGADAVFISGAGSLFNTIALLAAPPGTEPPPEGPPQIAGDCNQDGHVDVNDLLCEVHLLYQGFDLLNRAPQDPPCGADDGNISVLDVNSDAVFNSVDIIHMSSYLFGGGAPPDQGTGCFGSVESCGANPGCQ